ncbi:MFS transporter [Bradyrhizobium sp.]|uniref:MFS transporter n=1 Tax=Bradyrhizobium sp. TaxID=376 RepID=UPI0039E6B2CA
MTHVRWRIAVLCLCGNTLSWLDRSALGVALPYMKTELGLDPVQAGYAFGAFVFLYLPAILLSGALADRFGALRLGALAIGLWSVTIALMGAVQGAVAIILLRMLLGLFESGGTPSWIKATMTWFPRSERARGVAMFDSGARFGATLALPVMAALIGVVGWRLAFVGIALLGLLWLPFWLRTYRDDPASHPAASREEVDFIRSGQSREASDEAQVGWWELLGSPTTWALVVLTFFAACQAWFNLAWVPTYLVEVRHFTLLRVGSLGAIPGIAGIAAGFMSGILADLLLKRGFSTTFVRKGCIVSGLALSSCIALTPLATDLAMAMTLLAIANFGLSFGSVALYTLPLDLAPVPGRASSLGGIQIVGTLSGGLSFPLLVGYLLHWSEGSFVLPLALAGATSLLAACVCLFILGPISPIRLKRHESAPLLHRAPAA